MNQSDPSTFAAVPPNVRVRWIEQPTAPKSILSILWEGQVTEDDYLWSDHNGTSTVSEHRAIAIGCVRDGTVRGVCAGTLLIAGDDGSIVTLPVRQVRVLPREEGT